MKQPLHMLGQEVRPHPPGRKRRQEQEIQPLQVSMVSTPHFGRWRTSLGQNTAASPNPEPRETETPPTLLTSWARGKGARAFLQGG